MSLRSLALDALHFPDEVRALRFLLTLASNWFQLTPPAGARKLVDSTYHGFYTLERQRFQDDLVTDLVENNGRSREKPMLLFHGNL